MKHIRLCTAIAVSLLAQVALAQSSSSSSQTTSNSNASNAGANSSTNTSSSVSTQNAVSGSTAANNNSQNNGSASSVNATFTIVNPAAAAAAPAAASSLQQSSAPDSSLLKQGTTPVTEQRTYVEYGGTQTIKNVPSIAAPPLASSNDTCMGSASGGLAVAGFGITGASTYVDEHCKRIKMSRELWNKGMKAASLAMDCMDRDAREALELTGFVCPQTARAQRQAAEAALQAEIAAGRKVKVVALTVPPPLPPAMEPATAAAVPTAAALPADPPSVPPAPAAEPPAPVAAAAIPQRFVDEAGAGAAPAALREEGSILIRRVDDGAPAQQ